MSKEEFVKNLFATNPDFTYDQIRAEVQSRFQSSMSNTTIAELKKSLRLDKNFRKVVVRLRNSTWDTLQVFYSRSTFRSFAAFMQYVIQEYLRLNEGVRV